MRVLVAEGQKMVRRVIFSCLEKFPASFFKANDVSGLEILLQQQADLLILDTSLVSGPLNPFVGKIREAQPLLPIILTSYRDGEEAATQCRAPFVMPLIKPFMEKTLGTLIETMMLTAEANRLPPDENGDFLETESLPSASHHPAIAKLVGALCNVADSDLPVLICGEAGVGKKTFARRLHQLSPRKDSRFVRINCTVLPSSLLEAELFGAERGAFPGALTRRSGKFELARKGTLLLDNVDGTDLSLQPKLLRAIEEKESYRMGGTEKILLDVRLVATTHGDLKGLVKQKKFREELYYRLNVISLRIPPLRERPEDIPVLAQNLLKRFDRQHRLSPKALQQLTQYSWPGNIRELGNVLTRTAYLTPDWNIETIYFDEAETDEELPS